MTDEKEKEIEEKMKNESEEVKMVTRFATRLCLATLPPEQAGVTHDYYKIKKKDKRFEAISNSVFKKIVSLTVQDFCEALEDELFSEPYGVIPNLSESEHIDRDDISFVSTLYKDYVFQKKSSAENKES